MGETASRFRTIILGGSLSIAFISYSSDCLSIFFLLVYLASMFELAVLVQKTPRNILSHAIIALIPIYNFYIGFGDGISLTLLLTAFVTSPIGAIRASMGAAWFFPSMWCAIQLGHESVLKIVLLMTICWMSDGASYLAGKFVGRNKLAPSISPNKTIEGAFAGFAGSLLFTKQLAYYYTDIPYLELMTISLITSIIGQLGDLAESAFKRHIGVKDSGWILGTGHSGICDRFDSIYTALPAAYIYLNF